ncbi:MAG: ABC transporter permease [Opitutaceae bacterium]|nr:ABC transporter permease [Opitutaceae bacterium]
MKFILQMAWRDSRASRRRLLLFSLSVVLGIAALVAIGSLGANLERSIDEQALGLLGADLIITGRNEPSAEVQRHATELGAEVAREFSFSSMIAFPGAANQTRLVNVRALEGNFPFYGDFTTDPADAAARFKAGGAVAIIEETLLRQFDARVGDAVKLGNSVFTIVGALQKLPGESSAISATIAPRALIPMSSLEATGLADRNVLIRHRLMLKLPADKEPGAVESDMRRRFRGERLGFDTVAERKRDLGRVLENIEGFLSLVGFVALFLGGIGIASAIHVYVRQKITTVAVLRCIGATAWQSFAVYLVQGLALGIFGAVVGAVLGIAVQLSLPPLLEGVLPFDVNFSLAWAAVLRGMGAGLVICVLFTLLPLLSVRKVSPLVALRSAFAERVGAGTDPWRIAIGVFIVVAVVGFSIWQTNRLRDGFGFAGVLIAGFGILAGLAKLVAWAARRASLGRGAGLSRRWSLPRLPYVVRQGVANLYRPNNRTVLLLVSLGLGTFLMLTLFLTRTTLLKEIEFTSGGGRPNLLFFDIQDDQIEPLTKITAANGAPVLVHAPIVTMRISALKGRKVDEWLRNSPRDRRDADAAPPGKADRKTGGGETTMPSWALRREYRSTYRGKLEGTERLVSGTFTGRVSPGEAVIPISVEEGLFRQMGLKLGDEIEWDVQGVPMRSRVMSVRAVEWRRLEPNFFVVFPEGVLEPAPKFHVAAVRAENSEHSARVQRAVVDALPSVTAIDLALVMQTVDGIFSKVAFVIQFMALFTVLTGLIVLVSAVMTGRYQRIRETVLLRTLGANRRQLVQIQLVEYAILGVLAAVVGCALSIAGNALLAKFIFRITPSTPLLLVFAGGVGVCIVTVIAGMLTSRGITDHPPLEVLRQET